MATKDSGEQWAEDLVLRVGAAAKKLRGKRSARWLAERTAELGYPISPQVIARFDAGRRGGHLEVAELLVLARALNVPPVALLFPDLPNGRVAITPGVSVDSWSAARLFSGEMTNLQTGLGAGTAETLAPDFEVLFLLRRHDAAVKGLLDAAVMIAKASDEAQRVGDPSQLDRERQKDDWVAALVAKNELDSARRNKRLCELRVQTARQALRDLGVEPPSATDYIDDLPVDELIDSEFYAYEHKRSEGE